MMTDENTQDISNQKSQKAGSITIGDKKVELSSLSKDGLLRVQGIQFADAEIARLKMKIALCENGRKSLLTELQAEISEIK
jgi:hypothetical protein